MSLEFMTPDVWNGLVLGVVIIGLALAALRLYRDLSGPPRRGPDSDHKTTARRSGRVRRR